MEASLDLEFPIIRLVHKFFLANMLEKVKVVTTLLMLLSKKFLTMRVVLAVQIPNTMTVQMMKNLSMILTN